MYVVVIDWQIVLVGIVSKHFDQVFFDFMVTLCSSMAPTAGVCVRIKSQLCINLVTMFPLANFRFIIAVRECGFHKFVADCFKQLQTFTSNSR